MQGDLETLDGVLGCCTSKAKTVLADIARVEAAEKEPAPSAIMTLLSKEDVGKALVQFARATAEERCFEVEVQDMLDEARKGLGDIPDKLKPGELDSWCSVHHVAVVRDSIMKKLAEGKITESTRD